MTVRQSNKQQRGCKARGRGRQAYRNTPVPQEQTRRPPAVRQQPHFVKITGINIRNINATILKAHLADKAHVTFLQFNAQESGITASLATKAEALSLQNISGCMFANKKLTITYLNSAKSSLPERNQLQQSRKTIESFVTRHYDTDARLLDLSNLSAFLPDVSIINFNSKQFAVLLESILAVSCPDILTLVLNQNKISTLAAIAYLLQQNRLKIINLSLDSNQLSDFDELLALKNIDLRELVLLNNPISDNNDEISYKLEVVKRLPNLVVLDMHQVKLGADPHPNTQLPPIQGSFFDNPTLKEHAETFLKKYYDTYDTARDALVGAYAEQSCFSLSHVPNSQPQRRDGTSFRRGKFAAYDLLDRNLNTNTQLDGRVKTLKTGPTHIVGTLIDIPQSKHDYSSFTIDCFVSSIGEFQMMNVFVQGSFQETVSKTKRCFSRVFLLVPAPADSKHEGWPLSIINDQFYIRPFTQKKAKPAPPQLPANSPANEVQDLANLLSTVITPSQTQAQAQEGAQSQEMIKRMSDATRMNAQYSQECLAQNNWNFERAYANFEDLMAKHIIPAEAFVR